MQANIFKIKRNELADGSGLRTTIYFKGCPLRCVWCSTPQAHERPTQILWDSACCPRESGTASTVSTAISVSANVPPEVWHFQTTVSPLPLTPVHSAVPVRITVRPECFISSVR